MSTTEEMVFNPALEDEVLTDKTPTKRVPCRKCGRGCVVTLFATAAKTECRTCRGDNQTERREQVVRKAAETIDPAKLEHLVDGLINPEFKHATCPFGHDHEVELKSIAHSPAYGPRHLKGYDKNSVPQYDQQTGESATFQCNTCKTVVSFSTMHPALLAAQNEARQLPNRDSSTLERILGVREPAPTITLGE